MGECYNPQVAPYRRIVVNGEDISSNNPLPVSGASDYIDLDKNPESQWEVRDDGQPDRETATLINGDVYYRTFTYNASNILILRSKWIKV
jgi:hypothetical protein